MGRGGTESLAYCSNAADGVLPLNRYVQTLIKTWQIFGTTSTISIKLIVQRVGTFDRYSDAGAILNHFSQP